MMLVEGFLVHYVHTRFSERANDQSVGYGFDFGRAILMGGIY